MFVNSLKRFKRPFVLFLYFTVCTGQSTTLCLFTTTKKEVRISCLCYIKPTICCYVLDMTRTSLQNIFTCGKI